MCYAKDSGAKDGKGATSAIQNCIAETDHQRREKAATADQSRARNTTFVVHGAFGPAGHAPSKRRERAAYTLGLVYPFPDHDLVDTQISLSKFIGLSLQDLANFDDKVLSPDAQAFSRALHPATRLALPSAVWQRNRKQKRGPRSYTLC